MIFNVPGHIDMIRNGIKTQTRRMKRSYYQIEVERKNPHDIGYAVQQKRGAKGEPDIRIVMDGIWEEPCFKPSPYSSSKHKFSPILSEDAWREGGYTWEQYEKIFLELNPKWDGWSRWAFEFHVIENKISKEEQQKLEESLKHLHQEITEHIHPYVATKIEKIKKCG